MTDFEAIVAVSYRQAEMDAIEPRVIADLADDCATEASTWLDQHDA